MKFEASDRAYAGVSQTTMPFDISAAPVGTDVFLWALSHINSNTISLPGWDIEQNRSAGVGAMKCMLLHRKKQSGDGPFTATWGNSTYSSYGWVSYSGIKSYSTESVFLVKNTSGSLISTNSISYAPGTWAIGFFAGIFSSAANWTPDPFMTERIDLTTTSPYLSMEISDTNGPVNATPKSFTAQTVISFTYGLAGTVTAVPDSDFTGWGLPI